MAPAPHSSTPSFAAWTSGQVGSTGAFSPPAGSLLVAFGFAHSNGTAGSTATISDNSAGAIAWTSAGSAVVQLGGVFVWVARLSAAQAGLTVSVTTAGNSAQGGGVKVHVITGHDVVTPTGGSGTGSSTSTTTWTTTAFNTLGGGSMFLFGTEDDSGAGATGAPTSSDLTASGGYNGFPQAMATGYKFTPATPQPVTATWTPTGTVTATHWNWVGLEIRSAPGWYPRGGDRLRRGFLRG